MAYTCVKGLKNECDGCMDCKGGEPIYYCPICGEEVCETVFVSNDGEVLGCDNCAHIKEPQEMLRDET